MEISGLPVHVLVVHAAVVFTPLAVISAILFAVVPKWRYLTRWPTGVLVVVSTVAVWVAKLSGPDLQKDRGLPDALIRTHEQRGDVLAWVMLGFLVVGAYAVLTLGGPSGLVSGSGARTAAAPWAERVVPVALVVLGIVVLVWVVLTGDAGARATWG
ncbi:MAG: hypothetical protein QM655_02990 [Nocardioidaceae bacterium]